MIHEARLYGIVDLGYVGPDQVERIGEEMIDGGVDLLQLRAKDLPVDALHDPGRRLLQVTTRAKVPLIINDHADLAALLGADGVHVGQDDLSIAKARAFNAKPRTGPAPTPFLVGKSTHSVDQAIAAEREGADYIGFGPLFPTATKPGRAASGLADIRRVHEAVKIPIFCIGGIRRENLDAVIAAGARRVVIVSAILQAADVSGYCREIKARLETLA